MRPTHFSLLQPLLAAPFLATPHLISLPCPRGDSGLPDDKDKDNKNLTALLARNNNDAMALASQLLGENADLRAERRQLRGELQTVQGKALGEGQVAFSSEDAALLDAYKKLGAPDVLGTALSERDAFKTDKERLESENATLQTAKAEAETKAQSAQRKLEIGEIAGVAKFKTSVLADMDARTPGLSYHVKDVSDPKTGQSQKVAFASWTEGEGDAAKTHELPLADYAQKHWSDYLPALQTGEVVVSQGGPRHVVQNATVSTPNGQIATQTGGNRPAISLF